MPSPRPTVATISGRRTFEERLDRSLARVSRADGAVTVVVVDIDGFKDVTGTFGHTHADAVLAEVGRRLRTVGGGAGRLGRQGWDGFLLRFDGLGAGPEIAVTVERVLAAVRLPLEVAGQSLTLSASAGVAIHPQHGEDAQALLANADLAMGQAKAAGRDTFRVFDPFLRARIERTADLRTRLVHALDRDEFRLHYQPQVCLRTGRTVAVEALLRWESPAGPVPPLEFIPLAEQSGLIVPLGEWVLRTACRQVRAWQDAGAPAVRVGVNLSARQFVGEGIVAAVKGTLAESGLHPRQLELEITESLAMANPDATRRALESLRRLGVSVALDDFGTGYSSLAYLRQFPLDRLKIDRSFLAGATENDQHRAIVSAIISLAHAIRLEVVGEGVETAAQLALLEQEGCDEAQGYGLARPMSAEACATLLLRGGSLREAQATTPLKMVAAR